MVSAIVSSICVFIQYWAQYCMKLVSTNFIPLVQSTTLNKIIQDNIVREKQLLEMNVQMFLFGFVLFRASSSFEGLWSIDYYNVV